MSNYKRSTRACTFEEIHPILKQALHAYFIEHEIAGVESQILICCETLAERKKTGTLETLLKEDRDLIYHLAAFVTPEWLVWARTGDQTKTTVVAARLKDIRVRQHASLMPNDIGIDIEGFIDGSFSKVHGFLALGPEPVAEEFCNAVEKAVHVANPPRRLIDLFGKLPH